MKIIDDITVLACQAHGKEEELRNAHRVVERAWWQFPFYKKTDKNRAEHRLQFALQYDEYLIKGIRDLDRWIKRTKKKLQDSALPVEKRELLQVELEEKVRERQSDMESLQRQIFNLEREKQKVVALPRFSMERTLCFSSFVLCVVLPLVARFSSRNVVDGYCLQAWAIVLMSLLMYGCYKLQK